MQHATDLYHHARHDEGRSTVKEAATAAADTVLPALRQAFAGATGAAISNVLVYPLDLVVTRLKVQRRLKGKTSQVSGEVHDTHYNSILDAFAKIYEHEGGLPAFYGGVVQDTLKSVIDAFLFFLAYNILRRVRRQYGRSRYAVVQILDQLSIGVAAGAFSKLLTTPIQIVVTRKQIAAMASARKAADDEPKVLGRSLGVQDIVRDVYRKHGLAGFWSGYSATLLLTLNPSLTFSFESLFKKFLHAGSDPAPSLIFLAAASAKASASALLYPLSLAKSRAQAAGASSEEVEDSAPEKGVAPAKPKPAQKPYVLTSLVHIARDEGFEALYSGLVGEVIKGFLAHGITMLAQQRIQPYVIKLWYLLADILRIRKHKSA